MVKAYNMLYDGMSELYDCTNVHPKSRKKLRHKNKPWWNSTLTILWKVLCKAEHEFLKCTHGIERKRKRNKHNTVLINCTKSVKGIIKDLYKMT